MTTAKKIIKEIGELLGSKESKSGEIASKIGELLTYQEAEITAKIGGLLSSKEAKAEEKNAKVAGILDKHVGAKGKLVARYAQFQKHSQPVNLALLMALAEFLVSKKEFETKLDEILKEIDEIKDTD